MPIVCVVCPHISSSSLNFTWYLSLISMVNECLLVTMVPIVQFWIIYSSWHCPCLFFYLTQFRWNYSIGCHILLTCVLQPIWLLLICSISLCRATSFTEYPWQILYVWACQVLVISLGHLVSAHSTV